MTFRFTHIPCFPILVLCLISFCICPSAHAQWNNRKEGNIRGKVRKMRLNHMKLSGNIDSAIIEKAKDNDPFWFNGYFDESYLFNKTGNTIEYHAYFTNDADDNKILFRYEPSGLICEQRYYADSRFTGSLTYEYDKQGNLAFLSRYDADGQLTDMVSHIHTSDATLPLYKNQRNLSIYKYDDQGRCTEEKNLHSNGKINFIRYNEYNQNGQKIKTTTYDADNNLLGAKFYLYDTDGKRIFIQDSGKGKSRMTRYYFDRWNNETESRSLEVTYPQDKKEQQKLRQIALEYLEKTKTGAELQQSAAFSQIESTRSVYTYDKDGNWTERCFYVNEQPRFAQKRHFVYWK